MLATTVTCRIKGATGGFWRYKGRIRLLPLFSIDTFPTFDKETLRLLSPKYYAVTSRFLLSVVHVMFTVDRPTPGDLDIPTVFRRDELPQAPRRIRSYVDDSRDRASEVFVIGLKVAVQMKVCSLFEDFVFLSLRRTIPYKSTACLCDFFDVLIKRGDCQPGTWVHTVHCELHLT